MRTSSIFAMLLWCMLQSNLIFAQQPTVKKTEVQPTLKPNIQPSVLQALKTADLTITDNTGIYENAQKKRVLWFYAKNKGTKKSGSCVLEVKYSWRMDHEWFSAREIIQTVNVAELDAGEQRKLEIVIPDDQIRSNEGFGSSRVNISLTIDKGKVVVESDEDNNRKGTDAPILRP